MNDLELLKRYLQNEIDSGNHKMFIFDKDYNSIEFKIGNALSEIEFMEEENNKLQSNWNSLREWLEVNDRYSQGYFKQVLEYMNELEGVKNV